MSHECPVCGQTCYCNGDIDDCEFSGTEYEEYNCTHCAEEEWEEVRKETQP